MQNIDYSHVFLNNVFLVSLEAADLEHQKYQMRI